MRSSISIVDCSTAAASSGVRSGIGSGAGSSIGASLVIPDGLPVSSVAFFMVSIAPSMWAFPSGVAAMASRAWTSVLPSDTCVSYSARISSGMVLTTWFVSPVHTLPAPPRPIPKTAPIALASFNRGSLRSKKLTSSPRAFPLMVS